MLKIEKRTDARKPIKGGHSRLNDDRPQSPPIQSLDSLKALHPNEWLAVEIPFGESAYAPMQGRLIAHSVDRNRVWKRVSTVGANVDVFVFFTGPLAAKGFGMDFHDTTAAPEVAEVVAE